MELYRYRSYAIDKDGKNHDKDGLINSEIYFSELSKLNDPMEGYIDIYFQGDLVIWKNLLKNYIRSLFEGFTSALISRPIPEDPRDLFEPIVILHQCYDDRFQNIYEQDWFHELPNQFISEPIVSSLLNNLPDAYISRDQLMLFLRIIHSSAIMIVTKYMVNRGIFNKEVELPQQTEFLAQIDWKSIVSEDKLVINKLCPLLNQYFNSLSLLKEKVDKRIKFLFLDFPNLFIKKLEKLMYPEFYVACFTRNPRNSSMWGNYANSHQGICLKFQFDDKIPLYLPYSYGSNGVSKEFIEYTVNKVKYSNCLNSLNFFENIGNVSRGVMDKVWLIDDNNPTKVKLIDDATRERYWKNIYDILSQKTTDWEYEQEERLLLNNMFGEFYKQADRCIKYDFSCLEGIIFGLRTSDADKREIIDIISNKCKQEHRENFKFYQAFYNKKTCGIDYQEDPVSNYIFKSAILVI